MMSSRVVIVVCLAAAMAAGCSPAYYTEQADRQVYAIVADKNVQATGWAREFTIKPTEDLPDLLAEARKPEAPAPDPGGAEGPGDAGANPAATTSDLPPDLPPALPEPSPDAARLTIADALRIAVRASRDYQAEKETVYLAALSLTFDRYLFQPHPFATGSVDFNNTDSAGDHVRSWDGSSDVGVSQQLADGAVVTAALGLTALKFLNRELGDTVDSTLNFSLSQPLWRGAGRKIVQENLLQAERNALYAARSFARFEQEFAVSIASQYLRVLQQRDAVENAYRNYLSLVEGRERAESLAEAERLPSFQVDQARQDEFRAKNSWIVEREDYTNALDAFKITLGIPVSTEIALDPNELKRLTEQGLQHPDVDFEEARAKALGKRLDLANRRDGLDDAQRRIAIAEDGLKGDVDLVASIGYGSRGDSPQSARLTLNRGDYAVGFDLNLPIDRLQERNALRQTQISRDGAARTLAEFQDNVLLAVARAFRRLEQALESYQIQAESLKLAERRVDSTQLLLQAGRASQRDVLEAQRALLDARNALTAALVSHTIAGLEFQRDIGTLVVDEEGQIHGWQLTDNGR